MCVGLECEANRSPPSSTKVKNVWSCTSTTLYVFMIWCLIGQRTHLHGMVLC